MTRAARLGAPQALDEAQIPDRFACGREALNHWLRTHVLANQKADYTKVMAVIRGREVIGYYGLSLSSVQRKDMPRKLRSHPATNPIPCVLLGQVAVNRGWYGKDISIALLKDALIRAVKIAENAGTRAVVVNALDESAGQFWTRVGLLAAKRQPPAHLRHNN